MQGTTLVWSISAFYQSKSKSKLPLSIVLVVYYSGAFLQVLLSPHFDENGKISDFCDGDLSKRPPVFSIHPGALQIFLYYDDFDVTNPLTSKTIVLGEK